MANTSSMHWQPADPDRLARWFTRLGWTGFWVQVALLVVPLVLLVYVLFLGSPEAVQRKGFDPGNYLSYGSLVVLLFTTFWFYRYTRVGRNISDPQRRPAESSVLRTLWVGLWAGCLGIGFSMLLLFSAVGRILFVLLANPQTGIQLAPTPGSDPVQSLSAIDAISLTSLLIILCAELIVLGFTLFLLFKATRRSTAGSQEAA